MAFGAILVIKIYGFFIFLITLINFLFLDFVYAFHGIGKYFFIFLAVAFLWLGYSFSVYKYIKKPTIGIGRLQKGVLLLFIFSDFYFIFKLITSSHRDLEFEIGLIIIGLTLFFIIIKALIFDRFSKINKILKNPENFSDEKYYSEKSQEKGLIKTFGIFFIGLIIFYFTYYTTPPIEFKRIPDSYFDDSKLYKNVDSKENGLNILEKIKFHSLFDFIDYEKAKLFNISYGDEKNEKIKDIKFDKDVVEKINKDIKKFNEIKNKKIFIKKYKIKLIQNFEKSRGIFSYLTETFYNILYLLKEGNENKAIELLNNNLEYCNNGFDLSYTSIWGKRKFVFCKDKLENQLNYILDNYKIKKENLKELKQNIDILNEEKIEKAFKKASIYNL